jgi:hypothetical protein
MIELNKWIKENVKKWLINVCDKIDYNYLLIRIYQNYEIEYWNKHIFVWKKHNYVNSYSSCFDNVKSKTRTTIKNNYFYTLTK